jgi:isoleucyl-tRNA synthetase
MFNPVSSHLDLPRLEEAVQRLWQVRHIFRKSQSLYAGATDFVFYESPTSISRLPGIQDVPARAIKDLILRYKTQRGFHTIRRAGWNTHGLPVERSVEEQLGIGGKAQIQAYGLGRFNEQCRRAVFVTLQDWNRLTERLAYWIDLEEAYVTHTQDYIESVWWALKTLWEQKLLVKQARMVDYCPHCGTPLAGYEAGQGQTQTQSRSLLVRLPLAEDPGTSLLVRVLDPWMLPANTAVAAHPDEDYVIIERELDENPAGTGGIKERLILAKKFLPRLFGTADVKVYETFKGRQLKGLHYQPLFTYLLPEQDAYFVVNEPFEQFDDSTGLMHLAPAYDLFAQQTAERFNLPVFQILESDGTFISQTGPWRGLFFKAAEEGIAAELDRRGLILKTEQVQRLTSKCIHCQTPLLTLARPAWFILTSAQTKRLAEIAQNPVWFPSHIQPELSQTWLTQNPDWLVSRERFWGAPLPIWNCTACEQQIAVGSRGELSQLAGKELPRSALYRPYVDEIQIPCPNCGKPMQRVPDVLDTGFETSLMPFAQWHVPFENQELFSEQFPADLTVTHPEQAATWLNGLLTANGLLFDKEAFRSAVSVGPLEVGKDTPELELWDIFNRFGADALRWTLYTCGPVWETCRMTSEQIENTIHNFIQPLWELYSFFVENARSAKWTPGPATQVLALLRKVEYNTLERWLLSDLHSLIVLVTEAFDLYDVHTSTTAIQAFLKRVTRLAYAPSKPFFWSWAKCSRFIRVCCLIRNTAYTEQIDCPCCAPSGRRTLSKFTAQDR